MGAALAGTRAAVSGYIRKVEKRMSIRTTRKCVTFQQPWTIAGVDGVQPRGTYAIETDEEEIEGLSFLAYRRIATMLYLPAMPSFSRQTVKIDPLQLDAAQARDPEGVAVPAGPLEAELRCRGTPELPLSSESVQTTTK